MAGPVRVSTTSPPFSATDADHLRHVHTVKQAQMRQFHTTETLNEALREAGFERVEWEYLTLGIVALHIGRV